MAILTRISEEGEERAEEGSLSEQPQDTVTKVRNKRDS